MATSKQTFDPDTAFLNLPVVRWVFAIITLLALLSAILVTGTTSAKFLWNSDGLKNFVSLYQVPLGILASAIPFIALLAANHRSEQTRQQMALTRNQIHIADSQNRFSNYYKHLEEFEKRHKEFKLYVYSIASARKLHAVLFPDAAKGVYVVSEGIKHYVEDQLRTFAYHLTRFNTSNLTLRASRDVLALRAALITSLHLKQQGESGRELTDVHGRFFFPGDTTQDFVTSHLELFVFIYEIMQFDTSLERPALLDILINAAARIPRSQGGSAPPPFEIRAGMSETELALLNSQIENDTTPPSSH